MFGHGIQAYFSLLKTLILLFTILTLLYIPIMYVYSQGGAFDKDDPMIRLSLGNLGQASNQCIHQHSQHSGTTKKSCRTGELSDLIHVGFLSSDFSESKKNYCGDPKKFSSTKQCTNQYLDVEKMKK